MYREMERVLVISKMMQDIFEIAEKCSWGHTYSH